MLYLELMRKCSFGERICERASRLSRGLESIGVHSGDEVVVLCCAGHGEDREVALLALEKLGALAVTPLDWTAPALVGRFYLACEEGVRAWQDAGVRGVVVGEGPGVLWWKALECRHAAAVPA